MTFLELKVAQNDSLDRLDTKLDQDLIFESFDTLDKSTCQGDKLVPDDFQAIDVCERYFYEPLNELYDHAFVCKIDLLRFCDMVTNQLLEGSIQLV